MFLSRCLRSKPQMGRPSIGYPAAGTRCISILPSAPTNWMRASGYLALMALAIDTAGNICPPVPPPLMITLKGSLISSNTLLLQNYKFSLIYPHFLSLDFVLCVFFFNFAFFFGFYFGPSAHAEYHSHVYTVDDSRCTTLTD